MIRKRSADLQPMAAGLPLYRLTDVRVLREAPSEQPSERFFLKAETWLLLLSNASGGKLVVDGQLRALRPGALFVCAPGQLIELTNYSGDPMELLLLYFQAYSLPFDESAGKLPPKEPAPFPAEAALLSASLAGRLFGAVESGWREGTPSARLRCEAGLLELLSLALDAQERKTDMALESARLELERRYASDLTVDALARIAGLSRYHFMRLFKERYGKSVNDYRTDLRLRDAKRMMSEESAPLAEIASRIGYKSESYFSTLFKKQTGIAPNVYQRNQKRKIAAYSWVNFGQLVALQTIPFAAPLDQYWTDYYRTKYEFEVKVPLSHEYEFNRIALERAGPDRIVAIGGLVPAEEQEKLQRIAPTLFLSWQDDWRGHLRDAGRFLDREEEAERWLARYDRKAAAARERLNPIVGQDALLVLVVGRSQCSIWGHRAGTALYGDLGIAMPSAVREIAWLRPVEPSGLAAIPADRLLVHVEPNAAARARWEQLSRSEAWRKLPAVRNGRVHAAVGAGCFEAPWNEYAADSQDRFMDVIPRLFGCKP